MDTLDRSLACACLAMLLTGVGCGGGGTGALVGTSGTEATTGSLSLRFGGTIQARGIPAALAINTTSVSIQVLNARGGVILGPLTQSFTLASPTVTLQGLPVGPDTVIIQAFNSSRNLLSQGQTTVTIQPGTNTATVTNRFVPQFFYTATQNGATSTVLGFQLDPNNGAVAGLAGFPVTVSDVRDVVADQTGSFLYAAIDPASGPGSVQVFSIDPQRGALTAVPGLTAPAGTQPELPVIDPTNRFLYLANFEDFTVGGFSRVSGTGGLAPVPGQPFNTLDFPTSVTVDGTGSFLYAADSGNAQGGVDAFQITGTSGTLAPLPGSPFLSNLGGITDCLLLPTAHLFYALDHVTSQILVTPLQANGTLGAQISGSPFSTGGHDVTLATFDPTGQFLYVADSNGSGSIDLYTIDPTTGAPTFSTSFSSGVGAHDVTLDPTGQFLFVAAQDSSGAALEHMFQIQTGGQLVDLGSLPAGAGICGRVTFASTGQETLVATP